MSEIIPGYDCLAEIRKIRDKMDAEFTSWEVMDEHLKTAQFKLMEILQKELAGKTIYGYRYE